MELTKNERALVLETLDEFTFIADNEGYGRAVERAKYAASIVSSMEDDELDEYDPVILAIYDLTFIADSEGFLKAAERGKEAMRIFEEQGIYAIKS